MVARRQELGRLPRDLAAFCRSELADRICPPLAQALPWLGGALRVEE